MRTVRPALALAAVACLVGGVAQAATKPKPVCNLITDVAGDAYVTTAAPAGPSESGLDILSADIAVKGNGLTAAIRLSSLAGAKSAPTGTHVVFTFESPSSENTLYLEYFSGNDLLEPGFNYGYDDPTQGLTPLGDASGVLDAAKKEIRITAPTSGFTSQGAIKPGQKLSGLAVQTSRDVVVLLPYADLAESAKTYTVGAASCVKVG